VTSPGDGEEPNRSQTLLSGVDALVQLLVLRHQLDERHGLRTATMVSGYPGSPLGTLDLAIEQAGELLAGHRVRHQPGLNEELAAATVWGSQMGATVNYAGVDGVAGVWYGKSPGLDRSGDVLKHGNAMGAGPHGGVVLFCGDDPTAKSSTLACDSQYTFEDACIPVLFPGNQQDILDLGIHAFHLSRYAGCWVGLKIVTSVADGIGSADLDLARHAPVSPSDVIIDGRPWRHRPLATVGAHPVPEQELLVVDHRLAAARAYARRNGLDRASGAGPGARLGIVCAGKTYFDVRQAFADMGVAVENLAGIGVRLLKLGMTYPLVGETILEFAAAVDELVVIEEKRPFIETQVRSILHEAGNTVPVSGKRDRAGSTLTALTGELDANAVATILRRVVPELGARHQRETAPARLALPLLPLPARPPGFCSGCPHNRSTVFPVGALVGGGVGCHGIMYFEARHQGMKSLPPTPMGAEGVPWIGLAPFVAEPHLIQNLGDGTLSHSGTLAIRASVAAGVNVTFKILYNTAVAMTGGQAVTGLLDVPALTRALAAEGVRRIVVCADDPTRYGRRAQWPGGVAVLGRDRLPQVQEELRDVPGVTVIVYDQRCAAEARRLRKRGLLPEPPRRVIINTAVCEGCGDCSAKSNCLSVLPVETEFGEKRQIHDPSCNRDYTCLEGDCPSFVTVTPKRRGRRRASVPGQSSPTRPPLPAGLLPDRPSVPPQLTSGRYGIYFTGIGGTGVVTANRIVAAAAEAAGYAITGMDQTGLSQKAGAVVSHLQLATDRGALAAATISSRGADLYLSGDILQAAGDRHLEKVDPGRTIAVIDENLTPTAAMLQTGAAPPDVARLKAVIADRVGPEQVVFLNSKRIAEAVFADHLLANVVLLGAAYQAGGLPLSLHDIDTAMLRQGRAAADNRAAFAWGRWAVHDPAALEAALDAAAAGAGAGAGDGLDAFDPPNVLVSAANELWQHHALPAELRPLLIRRAAQVIDYQNRARGRRYLALVERAARHDSAAQGWALTRAVAAAWFKLLTYKDEYEVARLHLRVNYDRLARQLGIDGAYSVKYHLHPPTLRRMGLKKKVPMGVPYEAAFHVLQRLKRLRETPLDPFGRDPDRRTERALMAEYEQLLDKVLAPGSALPYETQVALAESVLQVKGYGPIKEAAVARWREVVAGLQPVQAPPAQAVRA
jgi:indolepyruvate ferredoxin oxidoreductase